ncbi:type VI secretion system protein TssA [Endozoicomonas lisbonensis]|uniref:Type VI secretion system protein ImpA n=1 Tax=Endozoicomonas lisbonensis TaxID=3120522 RepID=A0ABV2SAN9_9GAMM
MSSVQVMDIEQLLAPISDEQPQGSDIRENRSPTSDYYTIKDARNTARATERSGLFDEEVRQEALSQWQPVFEKGQDILANTSKDLEVATWLMEAAVRLHGFAGLRDGLTVLHGLVEQFWDGVYPEPDEDGLETKVAPITGLNGDGAEGTLLAPVRNCPVTAEGNKGEFTYFNYQQIYDASKITDEEKRADRYEALGHTLEDITQTISTTGDAFYLDLVESLEICNEKYKALNHLLYEHCGHDAPPSSQLSDLLDEVLRAVRYLCQDIIARAEAESKAQESAAEVAEDAEQEGEVRTVTQTIDSTGTALMAGPITNREQALNQLSEVAEYFRTYEPHTPLADGIDRIVRWGRMTVAELMMELMPEEASRSIFSQLTGVAMDGSSTTKYVAPPVNAFNQPSDAVAETADDGGWGSESGGNDGWGDETGSGSSGGDTSW